VEIYHLGRMAVSLPGASCTKNRVHKLISSIRTDTGKDIIAKVGDVVFVPKVSLNMKRQDAEGA
jgi:hypothetical protein